MKLLVTGGLGFIGSNFVRFALEQPELEQLLVIDKFTYAAQLNQSEELLQSKKFLMVPGDITESSSIFQAIKMMGPTHVLHLAAQTHVDRSIKDPIMFFRTNTIGTLVLLDMLRQYVPNLNKFVHVSTDEVYGSCVTEQFESDLLAPSSPYSASKASGDMVCNCYRTTFGMPITVVRPTNNYGPYQNEEKLIPKIIRNAFHDLPIPIYGDGSQLRDWMYVEDHCKALWMILSKGDAHVINIGAQNHISNLELAKRILDMIPESRSKIVHVEDRPAHDQCYIVNTDWIQLMGWKPTTPFNVGLDKTITWYHENYYPISKIN